MKTLESIKAPKAKAAKATNSEKVSAVKTEGSKKTKELANVIDTLVKKEQRFLYKFQVAGEKLTPAKAKQYRQKLRRKLDNFDAAIRLEKNADLRAKSIADFIAFYKAEFILNDFSLKSLTDSRDSYKAESFEAMLKVVQSSLTKAIK